ncbi:MAG: hypothetical protein ACJ8BF_07230 [Gemmatimonadales bacterium]
MMHCNHPLLFPAPASLPGVQAVRNWCWPAREQSWALKGVSGFYRADAARLRARSVSLIARSSRLRVLQH